MILTTGWEGYSDVLILMETILNKYYFSLLLDFRESLTLAMLQSGLNTLYIEAGHCHAGGVDEFEDAISAFWMPPDGVQLIDLYNRIDIN
jgi:hypothetical protein